MPVLYFGLTDVYCNHNSVCKVQSSLNMNDCNSSCNLFSN